MILNALAANPPKRRQLRVDDRKPEPHPRSPADGYAVEDVLAMLPSLPGWPRRGYEANERTRGARRVLTWLAGFPGDGWQDRWLTAGGDDRTWFDRLAADDPRGTQYARDELVMGLSWLLTLRIVRPSYDFLQTFKAYALFDRVRAAVNPDLFDRAGAAATQMGMTGRQVNQPLVALAKIVLHTGKDLDQLTAEDFFQARAWSIRALGRQLPGLHAAWELARAIGVVPDEQTLRAAIRVGQRPTTEMVDRYNLRCQPIRDVLVRYLDDRRPSMDYGSLRGMVGHLVGAFWADLEKHHPGIDSLRLPSDVALAWKERARWTTGRGIVRERSDRIALFFKVRSFYLDIQEWALEDPFWVPFAAPSPIRKSDTEGYHKTKKAATAAMHQRVRERLPQLPQLVAAGERNRATQQALLARATVAELGETFEHDGTHYRRSAPKVASHSSPRQRGPEHVYVDDLDAGTQLNLTVIENAAFWAWAVIETLRHTGVRLEELLEITHLALISYQLPDTGEVVPLLQVVPSKSDRERLLLVTPELASVLATIIARLRDGTGRIPLVARYDAHERTTGPMLPHLFQHVIGWRHEVISARRVQTLLTDTLALTGLTDAAGQPLRYTPHDFRRIFATEAVAGGLPVHIAARLLGHANLATTQAYLAVFQDDLIRAYRAFLTQRRGLRPTGEYREPTDQEWEEFQQHFQLRKLELGTCGRPYGTPCNHEHACVRCPVLRVDPAQRGRLVEIITNLEVRITEAQTNGWLGEVQGLTTSLDAARTKLSALDARPTNAPVHLGTPLIRQTG
ncbi:tyrosine-type recombinase/integrase [Micromonospora aurantiaca (nom. illeg.)]|uniref:tyrosine-type recombinase/integrase n=1 Tax=Micromonospora aurantiaca (nom. illeg.) TaxID=47850 RepID=UPI0033F4F23C